MRADARTRGPYRAVVGAVGGAFLIASLATGWLPGPGGIPLALIGLAILATEFHWASRLSRRAEHHFDHFVAWSSQLPTWARWLGPAATLVAVLAAMWGALVIVGLPRWAPSWLRSAAEMLPGV